ncbi:sulfurtransferase [Chitinasiproducens palmae]|uniref:Thiosulfate/3-mercaptopyruvate sulfurtransferase n=1 Tax=Chitinasiproducens palmae TaxID=1770053 RepID=A0A1H2PIV4_9BURK|nr:rhodanese-like domain-containing protein [Chitinasiproducens palmae]SDV46193.1 thiosulfate/3-mercaptopyruvate sulfurtransferase [Chitinasiproducens palmae]
MTQISFSAAAALPNLPEDTIALDLRAPDAYWHAHLRGARHVDATLFALPKTDAASVQQFEARLRWLLSTLGVARDASVLVYGDTLDGTVARAAWALSFAGLDRVTVLNGAFAKVDPARLTDEAPAVTAIAARFEFRHEQLATSARIAADIGHGGAHLVDARDADAYHGTLPHPVRSGHIPGARHWDSRREVSGEGGIEDAETLIERFAALPIARDEPVIVYCGSGPRASRTWLALQRAGFTRASVYQGSWSEWSGLKDLPVEVSAT